jgi:periplasmic protein TonB
MSEKEQVTNQQISTGAADQTPDVPTPDDHLGHLLISGHDDPWFRSFFRNIKEAINPPKQPPLQVTSKPVAVRDIWGGSEYTKKAGVSSLLIHGAGIARPCSSK